MRTNKACFVEPAGGLACRNLMMKAGYEIVHHPDEADVILFAGGADVSPALYGEQPIEGVYTHFDRDVYNTRLWREMKPHQKAVGICRGAQFLNVMNGGKLWQDVNNHTRDHELFDIENMIHVPVSSTHHQMMRPTNRAEIIAIAYESTRRDAYRDHERDPDGIWDEGNEDIEVVFYNDTNPTLCFQPHPEYFQYTECTEYFFSLLRRYLED